MYPGATIIPFASTISVADGSLPLADECYAASGDGDIAFIKFSSVDVGYRAATHEEVRGTITPRRLHEPRVFLLASIEVRVPGS